MTAPDPRLLLPATRALLKGWCGPGVLDGRLVLVDGDNDSVVLLDGASVMYNPAHLPAVFDEDLGELTLDLSRAECWDRVCRVLQVDFHRGVPRSWWFIDPYGRSLAGLDPDDDTRLPDGSRLVDALALAAVARHVLGGTP